MTSWLWKLVLPDRMSTIYGELQKAVLGCLSWRAKNLLQFIWLWDCFLMVTCWNFFDKDSTERIRLPTLFRRHCPPENHLKHPLSLLSQWIFYLLDSSSLTLLKSSIPRTFFPDRQWYCISHQPLVGVCPQPGILLLTGAVLTPDFALGWTIVSVLAPLFHPSMWL